MSTMPQGGWTPDQGGSAPQGGAAGDPWSGTPQGERPAQPTGTGTSAETGAQWRPEWGAGPQHARGSSPVPQQQTRVTGRRVVQYILDYILSGIIPGILYWALNRGHGGRLALGLVISIVLSILVYIWYWVIRPHRANGQTFGMQLLGIRIISKDGGEASIGQLAVRWILLIVDDLVIGLVGLFTILFSRYRQRVGDHVANTLVIRTDGGFASPAAMPDAVAIARPGSTGTTPAADTAAGAGTAGTTGMTGTTSETGTAGTADTTAPADPTDDLQR
jgi:uncharacterized RDD family membrane protein YckC